MKLIGLVGVKHSGKDTVANYIKSNYEHVTTHAFAKPLKEACKTLFLFTDEQLHDPSQKEKMDERWNMSPRQAFQFIGTDVFRKTICSDFWLLHFSFWFEQLQKTDNQIVVITDVRFQNEVDLLKKMGGTIIKINRQTELQDNHESEQGIHTLVNIDYEINNNSSLDDLYKETNSLINQI